MLMLLLFCFYPQYKLFFIFFNIYLTVICYNPRSPLQNWDMLFECWHGFVVKSSILEVVFNFMLNNACPVLNNVRFLNGLSSSVFASIWMFGKFWTLLRSKNVPNIKMKVNARDGKIEGQMELLDVPNEEYSLSPGTFFWCLLIFCMLRKKSKPSNIYTDMELYHWKPLNMRFCLWRTKENFKIIALNINKFSWNLKLNFSYLFNFW